MSADQPPPSRSDSFVLGDVDGDGDVDLKDAGLQAELDIRPEETVEQAWKKVLFRIGRMIAGFGLVLAGLAMMVLPGPGVITLLAGFVILSRDFAWADRVVRYIRRVAPGVEEEGEIPRRTIVISFALLFAGILGSIWWFGFGGDETVRGWF